MHCGKREKNFRIHVCALNDKMLVIEHKQKGANNLQIYTSNKMQHEIIIIILYTCSYARQLESHVGLVHACDCVTTSY